MVDHHGSWTMSGRTQDVPQNNSLAHCGPTMTLPHCLPVILLCLLTISPNWRRGPQTNIWTNVHYTHGARGFVSIPTTLLLSYSTFQVGCLSGHSAMKWCNNLKIVTLFTWENLHELHWIKTIETARMTSLLRLHLPAPQFHNRIWKTNPDNTAAESWFVVEWTQYSKRLRRSFPRMPHCT